MSSEIIVKFYEVTGKWNVYHVREVPNGWEETVISFGFNSSKEANAYRLNYLKRKGLL